MISVWGFDIWLSLHCLLFSAYLFSFSIFFLILKNILFSFLNGKCNLVVMSVLDTNLGR